MSIDEQSLRAIAFLAIKVRKATSGAGPWDELGLMSNLRKLQTRNLHMTVEHVLRHAADPSAKTPGVLQGTFTPDAPKAERARPPRREESCRRCGGHRGSCACTLEHLAIDAHDPAPTTPGATLTDVRDQLRRAL